MAKFKINNIFNITNRGQVLAGEIIAGEIIAGDSIQFLVGEITFNIAIKSVEFIDHISLQKVEIGLMLGWVDKIISEKLELMIGHIVSIEKI